MDEKKYLCEQIKKCRRRLNLARFLDKSLVWLAIGAVPAILLEAYSLLRPFYYVHLFAAVCVLLGLLCGLVLAVKKRSSMKDAARWIDQFGLQERTLTAYEQLDETKELALLQRTDAVECLRRQERRIRIRLCPSWQHLAASGCALLCLLILAFLPSAVREQANELHGIEQQAKEDKEKLDELIDEMEQIDTDTLTDEQQAALADLLDSLKLSQEELSQVSSQEALDAAQQKLSYKYDQTAAGLSNLASQLDDASQAALADAQALAQAASNSASGEQVASADNATASTGNSTQNGNGDGTGSDSTQSGSGNSNENIDGNGAESTQSGDGDGSAAGSGGGGQSGSNGDGSGSGTGSGTGSGNGGNGGGTGNGRGTGSSNTQHDYVSIPNALGDDDSLTGQKNGDDNSDYYRAQNGLAWEGSHVSLDSVVGQYTQDAYDGIASGKYPSGMEDVIKDYFKNLNE
jgi:hypothetical protein